ncbi:TnsA-like heteromeric transposase endonuclease subunit [Mycobacterium adipatum]|uniref:TnsA-like heteromeric transposase endonuclease subunit n=1 Tax=Mycobacterium adipatum TaxID=1682113 RepID=UPI0009ED4E13|nr:TnsA-like heteromeric transposase endonuclease subunit [Mycobacterium adipatum]
MRTLKNDDGSPPNVSDVRVHLRIKDQEAPLCIPISEAEPELLADSGLPWRTSRWLFGYEYHSGAYYSATTSTQVIYESRLQLRCLILADFDPSVTFIVAQPFQLHATVDGARRHYVPDYFLTTTSGPVVLDVAPSERRSSPRSRDTYAWMRIALATRQWTLDVISEPPPAFFHNVHMLAGCRRCPVTLHTALTQLRSLNLIGMTIGEAIACVDGERDIAYAALMQLLWTHYVSVDLNARIHDDTFLVASDCCDVDLPSGSATDCPASEGKCP